MTLNVRIKSMIAVSKRFWATPSITFTTGWCKFSRTATQKRWENIRILRQFCGTRLNIVTQKNRAKSQYMRQLRNQYGRFASANLAEVSRELVSYLLVCTLLLSTPIWTGGELLAQTKKTAKRRSATPAQRHTPPASGPKAAAAVPSTPKIPPRAEQQLEQLARALREKHNTDSYQRLSDFADAQANATLRARAALALGYYQYTRGQFPEARAWLTKAAADPLLADYALYWQAQTDRSLGAQQVAIEEFRRYRHPDSVMSDTAVSRWHRSHWQLTGPKTLSRPSWDMRRRQDARLWCCCGLRRVRSWLSQRMKSRLARPPITWTWSTVSAKRRSKNRRRQNPIPPVDAGRTVSGHSDGNGDRARGSTLSGSPLARSADRVPGIAAKAFRRGKGPRNVENCAG